MYLPQLTEGKLYSLTIQEKQSIFNFYFIKFSICFFSCFLIFTVFRIDSDQQNMFAHFANLIKECQVAVNLPNNDPSVLRKEEFSRRIADSVALLNQVFSIFYFSFHQKINKIITASPFSS